jgi:hypothetical protein
MLLSPGASGRLCWEMLPELHFPRRRKTVIKSQHVLPAASPRHTPDPLAGWRYTASQTSLPLTMPSAQYGSGCILLFKSSHGAVADKG